MKLAFLSVLIALLVVSPAALAQKPPEKASGEEKTGVPEIEAQLHKVLPVVDFKGAALIDVFDFLQSASGANLFVDWKRLEKVGVREKAPITYRAKSREFEKVISDILRLAGGNKPLAYGVDPRVLIISTKDAVAAIQELFKADDKLWRPVEAGPGFNRVLPEVTFNGTDLADFIDFLNDVTGAKIEVDWATFEKAGVKRNTPFSAKWRNVTCGRALRIVLLSASDKPAEIKIIDGAIHVAP